MPPRQTQPRRPIWIETDPAKIKRRERSLLQPKLALSYAATPRPSSLKRVWVPATAKGKDKENTCSSNTRNATLHNFMTPPTTLIGKERAADLSRDDRQTPVPLRKPGTLQTGARAVGSQLRPTFGVLPDSEGEDAKKEESSPREDEGESRGGPCRPIERSSPRVITQSKPLPQAQSLPRRSAKVLSTVSRQSSREPTPSPPLFDTPERRRTPRASTQPLAKESTYTLSPVAGNGTMERHRRLYFACGDRRRGVDLEEEKQLTESQELQNNLKEQLKEIKAARDSRQEKAAAYPGKGKGKRPFERNPSPSENDAVKPSPKKQKGPLYAISSNVPSGKKIYRRNYVGYSAAPILSPISSPRTSTAHSISPMRKSSPDTVASVRQPGRKSPRLSSGKAAGGKVPSILECSPALSASPSQRLIGHRLDSKLDSQHHSLPQCISPIPHQPSPSPYIGTMENHQGTLFAITANGSQFLTSSWGMDKSKGFQPAQAQPETLFTWSVPSKNKEHSQISPQRSQRISQKAPDWTPVKSQLVRSPEDLEKSFDLPKTSASPSQKISPSSIKSTPMRRSQRLRGQSPELDGSFSSQPDLANSVPPGLFDTPYCHITASPPLSSTPASLTQRMASSQLFPPPESSQVNSPGPRLCRRTQSDECQADSSQLGETLLNKETNLFRIPSSSPTSAEENPDHPLRRLMPPPHLNRRVTHASSPVSPSHQLSFSRPQSRPVQRPNSPKLSPTVKNLISRMPVRAKGVRKLRGDVMSSDTSAEILVPGSDDFSASEWSARQSVCSSRGSSRRIKLEDRVDEWEGFDHGEEEVEDVKEDASTFQTRISSKNARPSQSQKGKSLPSSTGKEKPMAVSSAKRKGKRLSQVGPNQSSLVEFGFFPVEKVKEDKRSADVYDEKFDREPHLEFEEQEEGEGSAEDGEGMNGGMATRSTDNPPTNKSLGEVPLAPPHPALRPAGIRELARRSKLSQTPPLRLPARSDWSASAGPPSSKFHLDPDSDDGEDISIFDVDHQTHVVPPSSQPPTPSDGCATESSLTASSVVDTPASTRAWHERMTRGIGSDND